MTGTRVKSRVARATGKAAVAITVSNECRVDISPGTETVLKKRRERWVRLEDGEESEKAVPSGLI